MKRLVLVVALAGCGQQNLGTNTGNGFDPALVHYSARNVLGAAAQPVIVVGRPAALDPLGGALTVTNRTTGAAGSPVHVGAGGSFHAGVDGALGDTLDLEYLAGDERFDLALELADDLSGVPPPSQATSAPLFQRNGADVIASYTNPTVVPPCILVNEDTGALGFGEAADSEVRVPAAPGAAVCLFNLGSSVASAAACETVP